MAFGHSPAADDHIDQHAEERRDDQEDDPHRLPPAAKILITEQIDDDLEQHDQIAAENKSPDQQPEEVTETVHNNLRPAGFALSIALPVHSAHHSPGVSFRQTSGAAPTTGRHGRVGSHVIVAGAGIVGLATALELTRRGRSVTVLEKESSPGQHQTGNNSGVIHSGLYYRPGSLKATLGTAGASSMRRFAEDNGVFVEICGKLVVATDPSQLPALQELHRRGQANGVPCRMINADEAKEYEPYVSAVSAIRVESTGIVDFRGVCEALRKHLEQAGGEDRKSTRLNSSHLVISYAVFCLKKKTEK